MPRSILELTKVLHSPDSIYDFAVGTYYNFYSTLNYVQFCGAFCKQKFFRTKGGKEPKVGVVEGRGVVGAARSGPIKARSKST